MAAATLNVFLRRLKRGLATRLLSRLPDQELLQQFLAHGDESAFEVIVHRHGPMVLRVCWHALHQTQDAEDAFQATFLLLARKARSIRRQPSLASWLHGVAHRVALQAQARSAAQRRHERRVVPNVGGPLAETPWGEVRSLLDEELQGLAEKWRLPLILCYLEGRAQEEAAGQLQWSTRTLRRRLEEARTALGRRLVRRGITLATVLGAHLLSDCVAAAAMPPRLMASVVEAAARVAAGRTAAGIVPASVTALTQGAVQAMFTSQQKTIAAVLLLAGALTTGAWALVAEGLAGQPRGATPGSKAPARPEGAAQDRGQVVGPRELPADKIISVTDERVLKAVLAADAKSIITVTAPPSAQGVATTRVKKWDLESGELRSTLFEGGNHYYRVALSPSGKQLLVGDAHIKETALYDISDLTNGPRFVRALANSTKAWSVTFAPDEKTVLVGFTDGSLQAYSLESGERRWMQQAHDAHVYSVAFSPDGKLVVTAGSDKTVQLRDAGDGSLKCTLEGHTGAVTSACFSPNGKLVASGGYDRTVRIWEVDSGKPLRKIDFPGRADSLAFSPDGKALAIGGLKDVGKTVLGLWDVQTGKQRKVLTGHEGGAYSVAFSADGTTVMAGGWEGGVGLWRLQPAPGKK
jgi:RNA polymerase sigma factor (sigma-70 family)